MRCGNACFWAQVSSKYGPWYSERAILQFVCVGSWAGITCHCYRVLTSPKKGKTVVHWFIGSCHVGVLKHPSHIIVSALQTINYLNNILLITLTNRSYFGSVYRMQSLTVSGLSYRIPLRVFNSIEISKNFPRLLKTFKKIQRCFNHDTPTNFNTT